jgi:type II secretion system protein G
MKYRCPHCRHLFDKLDTAHCPNCKKTLRHPEKWKGLKAEKARREAIGQRLPTVKELRKPIWMVFLNRPRFAVWVLGGCIIVGALILSSSDQITKPYQPPDKVMRTRKELLVMRTALEWFRVHCKRFPTTEESLKALVRDPGVPGWKGFYIEELPPDLWGHPFLYSSSNDTIRLSSSGPDGKPDTADDVEAPPPDYKALMQRLSKEMGE